MRNPWLDISLADYEAHMALPTVGQLRLIADALVKTYSPFSVAILGCAGGNGFDRLIGTRTSRVVGVDINPEYIESARRRYAEHIAGLELLIADIQSSAALFEPVDLIYAALGPLRVTTTNDNLEALRFYQRRGFKMTGLRPGAVDRARQRNRRSRKVLSIRLEPAANSDRERTGAAARGAHAVRA
jgi:hypothetical protein